MERGGKKGEPHTKARRHQGLPLVPLCLRVRLLLTFYTEEYNDEKITFNIGGTCAVYCVLE